MLTGNDILRRIKYALDLSDKTVLEIFKLSGDDISRQYLSGFLKKETDSGYILMEKSILEKFLDGLITYKRGKREDNPYQSNTTSILTNNVILRKIKISLELKEEDMMEIFQKAGFPLSKNEITALFRRKGHKNYKDCGDQLLRNFLKGLAIQFKKPITNIKQDQ